jgi:FKBP-type peptidyl-prolyl cis-trans isomerase FklB
MKRLAIFVALIAISMSSFAQKKKGKCKTKALVTHEDSLSYAFGLSIMENAKSAGFENLSDELIMQAIIDSKAGTVKLEKDKATGIINAEVRKNSQKKSDMNKKRGEDYLVENGKKPGVQTTSTGLQYKMNVEGQGIMPDRNDKVTVHYHGTTIDGVVFDSSVDRGKPATFGLNQVIPGWTEGLQLMKEGAKFTFYIPQALAYGSRAQGNKIEAFSTLVFEVELIKVEKID